MKSKKNYNLILRLAQMYYKINDFFKSKENVDEAEKYFNKQKTKINQHLKNKLCNKVIEIYLSEFY